MRLYTCCGSVVNCAKMLHLGILVLSVACLSPIFASPSTTEAPKVAFTLYYESLCPDCQQFIGQQLYPTYLKIGKPWFRTATLKSFVEEANGSLNVSTVRRSAKEI